MESDLLSFSHKIKTKDLDFQMILSLKMEKKDLNCIEKKK